MGVLGSSELMGCRPICELIITPIRLFTTSLPHFFDAAGDRLQGEDNA
jgi:hypothetical protein